MKGKRKVNIANNESEEMTMLIRNMAMTMIMIISLSLSLGIIPTYADDLNGIGTEVVTVETSEPLDTAEPTEPVETVAPPTSTNENTNMW